MFILAGLTNRLLAEEKKLSVHRLSPSRLERIRQIMMAEIISGCVFTFSALPFTFVADPAGFSYLRFECWYANFAVFFIIPAVRRRTPRTSPD